MSDRFEPRSDDTRAADDPPLDSDVTIDVDPDWLASMREEALRDQAGRDEASDAGAGDDAPEQAPDEITIDASDGLLTSIRDEIAAAREPDQPARPEQAEPPPPPPPPPAQTVPQPPPPPAAASVPGAPPASAATRWQPPSRLSARPHVTATTPILHHPTREALPRWLVVGAAVVVAVAVTWFLAGGSDGDQAPTDGTVPGSVTDPEAGDG